MFRPFWFYFKYIPWFDFWIHLFLFINFLVELIQPVKKVLKPNLLYPLYISFGIIYGAFWLLSNLSPHKNNSFHFPWNSRQQWPHILSSTFTKTWNLLCFVHIFTILSFRERHSHFNITCLESVLSWRSLHCHGAYCNFKYHPLISYPHHHWLYLIKIVLCIYRICILMTNTIKWM